MYKQQPSTVEVASLIRQINFSVVFQPFDQLLLMLLHSVAVRSFLIIRYAAFCSGIHPCLYFIYLRSDFFIDPK